MDIQHGSGLSPFGPSRTPHERGDPGARTGRLLLVVRAGVPLVIFLVGIAILLLGDGGTALEGSFTFFGVAIAVALLNFFFRVGVAGDNDRDHEEDARRYFDEHGHWPDESG